MRERQHHTNGDARQKKIDSRFMFADTPKWIYGNGQTLWGTELHTIQASTPSETLYEFEIPTMNVVLFGPYTGFKITGRFERKAEVTAAVANPAWENVPLNDYENVVVQPNWFEHLIKSVDVFHNNNNLKAHDVPRYVDPFLNTYLYAKMDEEIKKCLCPESANPGYSVPMSQNGWNNTANTDWAKYSATIFNQGALTFRYIPPFTFPFYQQSNFCGKGRPPAALLMPLLGKMTASLNIREDSSIIFKKKAANNATYRFKLSKVELIVQEARLNPTFSKQLFNSKRDLNYSGVTKFSITENIQAGVLSHRCRFQDIPYPEGIFIFALPKTVVGGQYKFANATAFTDPIFSQHNIDSVELQFENKRLSLKSPSLVGNINDHMVEIKQMIDHLENPPFAVLQQISKTNLDEIKEGGGKSLFPHIYINLCVSGPETRIVPIGGDDTSITKAGDLDVEIKFKANGATADVTYFLYAFYSDVSFIFDMKSRQFTPMYRRSRPNN